MYITECMKYFLSSLASWLLNKSPYHIVLAQNTSDKIWNKKKIATDFDINKYVLTTVFG